MIIQCKNREQYELLMNCMCAIGFPNLQVDIDEDLIDKGTFEEFKRLGEVA